MEQIYTLFPVLSSDKFNVSNFTKKSYIFTAWPAQRVYILHSLNGTIHQQTQHRKSSCYFQNLFFYTLLCSFFAVFAVWLVLYKNYKPQNTMPKCILSLEYSQLVQLDSGFGVTLHYHHHPSPLWTTDSQYLSPDIVSYHQEPNRIPHTDGRWK